MNPWGFVHPHVYYGIVGNRQKWESNLMDEQVKKLQSIFTVEYQSAIKNSEILPFAATWLEPEDTMVTK